MSAKHAHCSVCGRLTSVGFAVVPKGTLGDDGKPLPTTSYLRPVCAECVAKFPKSKVQSEVRK